MRSLGIAIAIGRWHCAGIDIVYTTGGEKFQFQRWEKWNVT